MCEKQQILLIFAKPVISVSFNLFPPVRRDVARTVTRRSTVWSFLNWRRLFHDFDRCCGLELHVCYLRTISKNVGLLRFYAILLSAFWNFRSCFWGWSLRQSRLEWLFIPFTKKTKSFLFFSRNNIIWIRIPIKADSWPHQVL